MIQEAVAANGNAQLVLAFTSATGDVGTAAAGGGGAGAGGGGGGGGLASLPAGGFSNGGSTSGNNNSSETGRWTFPSSGSVGGASTFNSNPFVSRFR